MIVELEMIKSELKKHLYKDSQETNIIDETTFKKLLFQLLRECIKEKNFDVNIGNYYINVNPTDLSVKYETNMTVIEVSNEDVYFETTRETETRFFCISNTIKDEFLMDTPIIRVMGIVTNMAEICQEHYTFELYTNEEDNIRNYLNLPADTKISEHSFQDEYSVTIHRHITSNSKRTDVLNFLNKNKVVPVYLDTIVEKYKALKEPKVYNPNNYSILLPTLDDKKKLVSFIYSSIVEYYTEYLNENN